MNNYRQILKQYWGYDSFRDLQEDIIDSIGSGKDTLGLMPTGGGKSITFQVPALAKEGLCLVITPLIALMKDQVQHLRARGIKATAIYTGMTRQEVITAMDNCILGDYKFLYISPERLASELFLGKLQFMNVSMITVDESHCISQWGYDFRPAYLKIADIRELLPGIPVLALTATATPGVVKDIQERLRFAEENVFRMSFERKNLAYIVRKTDNKHGELLNILSRIPGSSIIYVRNRRKTKEITELLTNEGVSADFYHAGLNNITKDARQKRWQSGECRVMVSTNAFGMGIDKPDVRTVIHLDLPDSPEAYFQEAGRGGRDGKKSYAVMLYSPSDKASLKKRITDTFPEKKYVREVYEHLNYYYQMAMGDGEGSVLDFNLEEFCRRFKYFPVPADSALKILSQAGYIEYTEEQDNVSRLIFTVNKEDLYRLSETGGEAELLIKTILRSYTGIFTDYTYINEESLSLRSNIPQTQVYELLKALSRQRVIDYIPHKKTPFIIYTRERVEAERLWITREVYEDRKERYEKRIGAMLEYVQTSDKCRSRMLLRYFGEKNEHDCGQCDACLSKAKTGHVSRSAYDAIREQLLNVLNEGPLTPARIASLVDADGETLAKVLNHLVDSGILMQKDGQILIRP